MNEPWASEYRLEVLDVARIVSENTALDVQDARVLDEGWDFFCYLINNTFAFRFPKRRSEAERLINENAFLAKLDLAIQTPRFDFWVDRPVGFDLPFAGYPLISGTPLFDIADVDVDANVIGYQLGQVLRELHAQALTPPRPTHDPIRTWLPGAHKELKNITTVIGHSLFETCNTRLRSYRPRTPSEPHVTTHGDLHAGHVLVDSMGELVGVIDWTDAHTSNRYIDFEGLWMWGGDTPVIAAMESYGCVPTREDWARLRTQAIINVVGLINFGFQTEDSELVTKGRNWLKARQNEGALDDFYANPV